MKLFSKCVFIVMLFSGAGCMSWDEGWKSGVQAPGKVDVKEMMAAAIALVMRIMAIPLYK